MNITQDDINAFAEDAYPDTTVCTHKKTIACSGENNDHPLVWLSVPDIGYVRCGYCDIKFMRVESIDA